MVLVGELERIAEPEELLHALAALARRAGVAVLATTAPLHPDLDRGRLATHITMSAHGLAGRAALVGTDPHDGLTAAQVHVDVLGAAVR